MKFILGGTQHELNYEDVVAAAGRVMLNGIDGRNKYYVDIGGRRLPVKALFAEATGLQLTEFITDDATRNLRKLSFAIHQFDTPPSSMAASTQPARNDTIKSPTHTFAVSLEWDEDGFMLASCPQLPGCHSQGRSREEAIRNIEEAIRGYVASMKVHGEDIPGLDWELIEVAL